MAMAVATGSAAAATSHMARGTAYGSGATAAAEPGQFFSRHLSFPLWIFYAGAVDSRTWRTVPDQRHTWRLRARAPLLEPAPPSITSRSTDSDDEGMRVVESENSARTKSYCRCAWLERSFKQGRMTTMISIHNLFHSRSR